ncbi:hypothetical protein FACS1894208_05470 [Clostridia bacterium]|nr:hypothetical protein FACS1894208_05470 [Clostridia bacterium]
MTLKELSQLYYLNREIELDQRRLEELRAKATSTTQTITDMPRASGVTDKVSKYVAEIVDLSAIISAKQQQCLHERNRLERYIANIGDSLTRQIFTLRFINGLNWAQIECSIGGGNTYEGMKKRVYRYIHKEKINARKKMSPDVPKG